MASDDIQAPAAHLDIREVNLHLAYAEASIMLIESLLLVLSEKRVIELPAVVESIEVVIETKRSELVEGTSTHIAEIALSVLKRIANSVAASRSSPP